MPPDIVPHVLVWQVWFTHTNCDRACPSMLEEVNSRVWLYDNWIEAASEIERRITQRPRGCKLDAIVDHVSMSKADWDALEERTSA